MSVGARRENAGTLGGLGELGSVTSTMTTTLTKEHHSLSGKDHSELVPLILCHPAHPAPLH